MTKINTKKFQRVNGKTLIATVDISKIKHTGYCRCPDGTEVTPFEFFNTGRGFEEFWYRVCQTKRVHQLEDVVVGFESTGPYGEPLFHFLKSKGVKLVQVNPFHTKRLKELQGNSPAKTDQKDPKVIADIIELGHALTVVIPEGVSAELRRLSHARERSLQRRTALLNQLQDLVFLIFPEFLEVMKDLKGRTSQYLLSRYPVPEDIVGKGVDDLTEIFRKISKGKLGRERAEDLCRVAQESVGIKEGRRGIVLEITECLTAIGACEQFIAAVEREMADDLQQIPDSRCILSIKGIGNVTVAGLIGEVGDFGQFRTLSEITKLAGLDLFEISSGKRKGKRRISKRGRSLLRKLLFFASLNVVRKGGVMRDSYQRYIGRGIPRKKALIAISRKLLRVIFALVRDHSEFSKDHSLSYEFKEAA